MTEYHARYRKAGVTIYWHTDKREACVYSQLKRCSSSEVAAMIQALSCISAPNKLIRHCFLKRQDERLSPMFRHR
jgi:hypothetical protein